jgi:DNA-binding phage protein
MNNEEPWYFSFRSEALTALYLTRRDDLTISKLEADKKIKFLVQIAQNSTISDISRVFGVAVKGNVSSTNLVQEDELLKINIGLDNFKLLQNLNFPICLFFFYVDNNQGYYKWLLEPVTENVNNSSLKFNEENDFKIVTDSEIDNIVNLVNNWYDKHKHSKSRSYYDYLISSLQDVEEGTAYLEPFLELEAEKREPELLLSALKDFMDARLLANDLTETAQQKYAELNQILLETGGNEIYTLIEFLDAVGYKIALLPKD